MGTRFTRVTVVAPGRRLDVSLPADSPMQEQLPAVLRLLSVPPAPVPVPWRLAAPEFGTLEPSRSLDEVGVLDGMALYLTRAADAPPPPFVDDVESAIADVVRDRAPAFTGAARCGVVGVLLTLLLLAAVGTSVTAPAPVGLLTSIMILPVALLGGSAIRERGGWGSALVSVPGAGALVLGLLAARSSVGGATSLSMLGSAVRWTGFPAAAVAVAAFGLALAGLVRRSPGITVAAAAVEVASVAALLGARAGLPADRTAGFGLVGAVLMASLSGRTALGGAGLVDLLVADERGEPVPRNLVAAAVERGLALAGGLVLASSAAAAAACSVLILGGGQTGWIAPAVGTVGGLVFALRSRMFTRAAHVAPMLAVPIVVVAAGAQRVPSWIGVGPVVGSVITVLILLVVGALAAVAGRWSLPEVAGARVQRGLDRLELLATLALFPGLVLLLRVIPSVQGWWS